MGKKIEQSLVCISDERKGLERNLTHFGLNVAEAVRLNTLREQDFKSEQLIKKLFSQREP